MFGIIGYYERVLYADFSTGVRILLAKTKNGAGYKQLLAKQESLFSRLKIARKINTKVIFKIPRKIN